MGWKHLTQVLLHVNILSHGKKISTALFPHNIEGRDGKQKMTKQKKTKNMTFLFERCMVEVQGHFHAVCLNACSGGKTGSTYLSPKALTEEDKYIVVYIETSLVPRFPPLFVFQFLFSIIHGTRKTLLSLTLLYYAN